MNSSSLIWIGILVGIVAGGLAMYCVMRILKAFEDVRRRLTELERQLKGKLLPFYVRDGLEEIKALENYDAFDLGRIRLYLEEAIKTVDRAADRQNKMGSIYDSLRNKKEKR